ncbi:hypothetical protein ONZ51_g8967 [Trametes cubensis]|uniref:DUF6533 domain-containing protein n=1 Tax=Trametes cubensis TaxID=1111947 RepID=A0AAD7TPP7_9APHY|nr:hypothetical protein ONZ51_g8967 [Trametes cubensis]
MSFHAHITDLWNATVCSTTYLLLEIISTLEDEIRFIWPSRWSIMKVIFLLNRYSPLIDSFLALSIMLSTANPHSCNVKFHILTYTYVIGTFLSEGNNALSTSINVVLTSVFPCATAILFARTLALYDSSPWIICMMTTTALCIIVRHPSTECPGLYVGYCALSEIQYPSSAVLEITGCMLSVDDSQSWAFYMCILISETIIIALTAYKMWQTSRELEQGALLVCTVYCDGLLCYSVMLVLSIINLCLMLLAPVSPPVTPHTLLYFASNFSHAHLRHNHPYIRLRTAPTHTESSHVHHTNVAARLANMNSTFGSRSVEHAQSCLAFAPGGGDDNGNGDRYRVRHATFRGYVNADMDRDLDGDTELGIVIELDNIDVNVDVDVDADGHDWRF